MGRIGTLSGSIPWKNYWWKKWWRNKIKHFSSAEGNVIPLPSTITALGLVSYFFARWDHFAKWLVINVLVAYCQVPRTSLVAKCLVPDEIYSANQIAAVDRFSELPSKHKANAFSMDKLADFLPSDFPYHSFLAEICPCHITCTDKVLPSRRHFRFL